MIYAIGDPRHGREGLATLTSHLRVRVLNCSADGCLLEATAAVTIGTVGKLRVSMGGREFEDVIQVVRCAQLQGPASVHYVGAKFLSTTPPYAGTLRYTMRCDVGGLTGWFDTQSNQDIEP